MKNQVKKGNYTICLSNKCCDLYAILKKYFLNRVSLRFEKVQYNIDSFRGFIENFSFILKQSEALFLNYQLPH